jgi:hypothetical protein
MTMPVSFWIAAMRILAESDAELRKKLLQRIDKIKAEY